MSISRIWIWGGRKRDGFSQFSTSGFAIAAGRGLLCIVVMSIFGWAQVMRVMGLFLGRLGCRFKLQMGHWIVGSSIAG